MASERRSRCQVVVIGDAGTGKTSLITAVATDSFPERVPPVLPPTRLPHDFYPDRVPLVIHDTSSRIEDKAKTDAECKRADAIVLTYACDRPQTLERLSSHWLPELRALEITVPVIVVGCKLDLRDDRQPSLEQIMAPLMHEFREIETCIECSSIKQVQVAEVFYYAQKAILHPTAPLFDQESQTLKPRCVRALKRIFILCDHDRDGTLNDAELNDFQVKCFNAPLQPSEVVGVKKVVSEKMAEGVSNDGLTLTGFLFLHALFIERGRLETTWTVLRKFGYNDEIELRDDVLLCPSLKRASDQSVELTENAVDFLKRVFTAFDLDGDGALKAQELDELFSTAPSSPWEESIYRDAAETNSVGGLTVNGFLSLWSLMTLMEPEKSLAHLIYIGYPGDASSAFRITRRRRLDRKKQRSQRVVFQAYVFGSTNSGKSALLNALVGRPYNEASEHTKGVHCVANVVEQIGGMSRILSMVECWFVLANFHTVNLHGFGSKKTLVLREVNEDSVASLLEKKDAMMDCDVAAFVYDSSDAASWKRANELLVEIAAHGEVNGLEVPCLLIAAKDDLDSDSSCVQNAARVCTEMGVEAPISVSMKLGDIGNLFRRIVDAAQRPHLSIPETEQGRNHKHYRRLVKRSLTVAAVGTTVAIAGIAIYRVYASRRKNNC